MGLIEIIRKLLRTKSRILKVGIGDDCLVLRDGTAVTIDSFIEGIHFDLDYFDFRALGHRLMAGTLSDLAAMAARPLVSLVSLMLPPHVRVRQVEDFYAGARNLARKFDCPIAGGDTNAAPVLAVTIAALGRVRRPALRSAVRPGDYIYLTGYPGLSETGRQALRWGWKRARFRAAVEKHLRPIPRIDEALRVKRHVHGMIDTSDGISTDVNHLAEESRVRIVIDRGRLPVHEEVVKLALRIKTDPIRFLLGAGEDFELLFSSRANLPERLGDTPLFRIGHAESGRGVFLDEGRERIRLKPAGYEHFRD